MNRETLLDHTFGHLSEFLKLRSGDSLRALCRDLVAMTDDELRTLYREMLW